MSEVNMIYVGVCHYYATGEGVTIYVACGSEESIRKSIPEYFHQGLTLLSPSDWVKAHNGDTFDEHYQSNAQVLKTYLPVLWKQIEERALKNGPHMDFFMQHYFNYS
jgi:hypothetical protein